MSIIEMDPDVAWAAIEGYQNVLDPEANKLEALYRHVVCPRCGGEGRKELATAFAFADPDTMVPRALLRCKTCECLYNPFVLDALDRPMIVDIGNLHLGVIIRSDE